MPDGTLIPELTQTTSDAQRVIEVYENDVETPDGDKATMTSTVQRSATLKEQVEYLADDIAEQAMKMVTLANSSKVEAGGSEDAPTVTVTLYAAKQAPDDKPTPTPSKAKASSS